jgi:hypothetical protein
VTARRSGAHIIEADTDGAVLELRLWDTLYRIAWPEVRPIEAASGEPCRASVEAAILYYLGTADGTPMAGEWISFQELPAGTFYHRAFQGYSGDELARHFGQDIEALRASAARVGGIPLPWGDAGFSFLPLPRVALAIVLFDKAASHYMPTDALAGLGAQLAHRIMRAHHATTE